jgi:hypothetical protein
MRLHRYYKIDTPRSNYAIKYRSAISQCSLVLNGFIAALLNWGIMSTVTVRCMRLHHRYYIEDRYGVECFVQIVLFEGIFYDFNNIVVLKEIVHWVWFLRSLGGRRCVHRSEIVDR